MNKLERQRAKLNAKRDKGEISEDVFHAAKELLETNAATIGLGAPEGTIWQQEEEVSEAIKSVEGQRSPKLSVPAVKLPERLQDDPLAELIAMKVKGEISAEEFIRARKLLEPKKHEEPASTTAPARAVTKIDEAFETLRAPFETGRDGEPQPAQPEAVVSKPRPSSAKTWVGLTMLAILVGVGYLSSNKQRSANQTTGPAGCFSPWDGSNSDFINQLTRTLRDPDSFEHIRTKFIKDNSGQLLATMEYRAKNGFGGFNVAQATAVIDPSSCDVVLILP